MDILMETPKIYIACVASYTQNRLRGAWVELKEGITEDEILFAIDAILRGSPGPAEEWRIDDSNLGFEIKNQSPSNIAAIAQAIHTHGLGAVQGFLSIADEEKIEEMADAYMGVHDSEQAFCEDHLGGEGGIDAAAEGIQVFDKTTLDKYINWEAIATDAFIMLYSSYTDVEGNTHIFLKDF
jgi:antirestriction protein